VNTPPVKNCLQSGATQQRAHSDLTAETREAIVNATNAYLALFDVPALEAFQKVWHDYFSPKS
jgi:hypothetical protein